MYRVPNMPWFWASASQLYYSLVGLLIDLLHLVYNTIVHKILKEIETLFFPLFSFPVDNVLYWHYFSYFNFQCVTSSTDGTCIIWDLEWVGFSLFKTVFSFFQIKSGLLGYPTFFQLLFIPYTLWTYFKNFFRKYFTYLKFRYTQCVSVQFFWKSINFLDMISILSSIFPIKTDVTFVIKLFSPTQCSKWFVIVLMNVKLLLLVPIKMYVLK